jgi:PIN domain nuclease of toxin-antitoxin system
VAIKQKFGKIRMSGSFSAMVHASEFQAMAITLEHAEATMALPPHHGDPFDRLLIAQARVEGATLVTHDERCRLYDVPILWV